MATYTNHNRPRLANVTVPGETELDEDIQDSMFDAICNFDGRADGYHMRLQLARRGLLIVEADKYGHAKMALQVIGSFPVTAPAENMDAFNMAKIAKDAIEKVEA